MNKFKALLLVMLKLSMLIGYAEIKHSYLSKLFMRFATFNHISLFRQSLGLLH